MKLGKDVLLEIMSILQDGIVSGTDVSQALRELDIQPLDDQGDLLPEAELSEGYLKAKGR